jgi:dihydrofolate reductase
MGRVIITAFVSLDGVTEAPEKWSPSYWNSETEAFKDEELAAHSAMILGRVTYEAFAQAWPSRTGAYADRLNGMPKYVASSTLKAPAWQGSEVLAGDLDEAVRGVRQQVDGDIYVHGSIGLSQALLSANLVDELHMLSYPIIVGRGRRLLEGTPELEMELISANGFANGVVALKYRRQPV